MHEKYCYGMTTTLMIGSGVQLDQTLKSSLDLIQQEYQEDDISEYINIQDNSRMNFEDVEEEEEEEDDDDDDEDDEDDDMHDPFDRPSSRLGLNMSRRRRISDVSVDAPSYAQLELEAIYLTAQNEKLERELEASRQTIQALKLIIASKDDALRKAAEDYQQAIMKVQVMEAVILSKHARSGSIIVRSGTSIAPITSAAQDNLLQLKTQITPPEPLEHFRSPEISSPPAPTIIAAPQEPVQPSSRLTIPQSNQPSSRLTISEVQSNQRPTKSQTLQPKKLRKKQPQPPPPQQAKSRPTIKHRRWSMDFGPKSRLVNDEDVDDGNLSETNGGADTLSNTTGTYVASCHSPSTSVDSTLTPNTDRQRRRPFIHSFTCHPSGNKHGFDLSPPSTPSSELSCDESSSDVSEDDDDEDVVVPSVSRYEKHSMPRKFFSSPLRIFSSTR